jgi:DNA-binding IclR family transcriptional regulator
VSTPTTDGDRNGPSGEVIALDLPASGRSAGDHFARGTRGLRTARAALRVLSFMTQHPEGVTARQVADELGKSVSTAYDLLASLYEEGFAFHEPGGGYRLCADAPIASSAPEPPYDMALSRAVDELFARTRRRSYLGQVKAGAIVITAVCGRQGIPRVPGLGSRIDRSAHALALGKVVLSLLPRHARERYIEGGLRSYTPLTITSPAALMSELDQVRSCGFAIDRGEFDLEYSCVAAPVPAFRGRLLAVLGLSTSSRTPETEIQDLVEAVRQVAAAVSGKQPPDRVELSVGSASRGQRAA